MTLTNLMWLLVALVVLTGLPLAVVENPEWRTFWGVCSGISLGLFAVTMAIDGWIKGQIRFQFSVIRRANSPILFTAAVGLVFIAGIGIVAAVGLKLTGIL